MLNIKTLATAALATACLATTAAADSYFFNQMQIEDDTLFTLAGVTSDVDGQVVVFDYTGGVKGDILGSVPINVGANVDLIISLERPPVGSLLAVLYEGDQMEGRGVTNLLIDVGDM